MAPPRSAAKAKRAEQPLPSAPPRAPTALEWEEMRAVITDRWEQKWTRKAIKEELATRGYAVTERMVLTRIHNWKLDRNSKEGEMAASARKLLARRADGRSSVVTIRHRRLDEAKLRRYARRKSTTLEELARRARSKTPETVVVRTPSPEPRSERDNASLPSLPSEEPVESNLPSLPSLPSLKPMNCTVEPLPPAEPIEETSMVHQLPSKVSSPRNVSIPDIYAVPESLLREIETYTRSRVSVLNGLLTGFVISEPDDSQRLLAKVLTHWMPGWDATFIRTLEDAQDLLLQWRQSHSHRDLTRAQRLLGRALEQFPSQMPAAGLGFLMRLTLIIHEFVANGFADAARVLLRCLQRCAEAAELYPSNTSHLYGAVFRAYVRALSSPDGSVLFAPLAGATLQLICRTIEANTIAEGTPHALPTTSPDSSPESEGRLVPAPARLAWRRVDDATLILTVDSPSSSPAQPQKPFSGAMHSPLYLSHARGSSGGRSITGALTPLSIDRLAVA